MKFLSIIVFFSMCMIVLSCTKQNDFSTNKITASSQSNLLSVPATSFGVLLAGEDVNTVETTMTADGINIVRATVTYSTNTYNKNIDTYLNDGYDVAINFNYQATPIPMPWPTDTVMIRQKAEAFFSYYQKWFSQIPVVVCENEWDYAAYHTGPIQDYLNELAIVVQVGHKYGFKVTDAGITDGKIRMFYQGNANIDTFLTGIKTIPEDYCNFHWYVANDQTQNFNLRDVVNYYLEATGKSKPMTNEFGLKTNSLLLWINEVIALKGFVYYGVAYSGTNIPNQAITLSNSMLLMLR
jgi:hypothetical protein